MTLDELRKLSPEQAMQAAAKEQGLPDDFYDRMWAQESGRGKNKLSPKGARGDFQIMPATQAAWEQRHGRTYNPDDFYDSLHMAVSTMAENIARFKDPVDATRAYNGGWKPARWKNPETVGYVQALWGDRAKAPASSPAAPTRGDDWPALPTHAATTKTAPDASTAMATVIGLGQMDDAAARVAAAPVNEAGMRADEARVAKDQARKDATGFGTVASAALRDPQVMPTWTILDRIENGGRTLDPSWDYMAHRERLEAGMEDHEREYMRENGVYSEAEAVAAQAQVAYRREAAQVYGDAGGFTAFAGQMAAGLTDPAGLLAGLGTVKAFQLARIGHTALAAKGAGGAAAASMLAENAVANIAIEGVADAMGEVKTSADYAMAGVAGAVLTAPFVRGVFRQANEAEIRNLANGLNQRATSEQVSAVSAELGKDSNLTPAQAARRVEQTEAETIRTAVDEASGPQRMDSVIPESVRNEMRDDFSGVDDLPMPKTAAADTPRPAPVFERQAEDVLEQIRSKGEVVRTVSDPSGAGPEIRLSWKTDGNKVKPTGNIAEALDAIHTHPLASPWDKRMANYLSEVVSKNVLDVDVRMVAREARSNFDPYGPNIAINNKSIVGETMEQRMHSLTKHGLYSIMHEVMHAATYHKINAWETAAGKLRADQRKILGQFQDLFDRFRDEVEDHYGSIRGDSGARYAASNLHEFAAQFFTDKQTRDILSVMPGRSPAGAVTSALREFMDLVKRVLGLDGKTAFDEGAKLLDQMIAMPLDNVFYKGGRESVLYAGAQPGTNSPTGTTPNPLISRRARDTWGERMFAYASDYMRRNPIDMDRLRTLTAKIGGVSDGLVLAASKNPIMQLVASLVTETTTGAAGRKANVAIRSHMLTRKFIGNAMIDYDLAYTAWRGRNGGGIIEDLMKGDVRRRFDEKVYEEVLKRRDPNHKGSPDRVVMEAADALEGLFERARVGQIDGGVLGFDNLPGTARGYMPQALDGIKLQAASPKDLDLLHKELARMFQDRLGFDAEFANAFAPFYTERARKRAMGEKNIEGLGAGGEGLQLVRDTLEAMEYDPTALDRARAAMSKQGAGQTKKRLDLDLLAELRPGLRLLDFYNTNSLMLARSYSKRTAGTIALTEAGIHGLRGMRELRHAALWQGKGTEGAKPTAEELAAYDRVMAEILGTPVAGAVVSSGASNLQLLVGLQRLGGLVFTQAAETFNMLHHLGLRSVLSGVSDLPRILGEVGRLKRGQASGNHILTSIEQYGGEIGTDAYKMIAPLDAPDGRLAEYADQPGVLSRLMRAGGHLQSKVSFFRGLMAGQHRMVAEQIVMRAARMIRDGGDEVALRDMGFTPEVAKAMKADLKYVAKWDANDKMLEFDLTRVSDARTAEAFVQAVHRGTAQIIQATFVGERSKWFHNDWIKLMLQLRTFGLTATEKQWARTRMNHAEGPLKGYGYAGGMMLAQMAFALPIHAARVQLYAAAREDRDKYIKQNMHPAALARATMNYSSLSGLTADVLEILSGVAGGWGDKRTQELVGARQQATSVGRVVPIAGSVDSAFKVISGKADLHTGLKQLPFSNLWYLAPALNLTKDK